MLILLMAGFFTTSGQILQPVKWSFDSKQVDNDEYDLIFTANIDPGWHVYGTDIPEGGPIATSFNLKASGDYDLVDKIKTPKPIEKYDSAFEMELRYFEHGAKFTQRVKMKSEKPFKVTGELEFMACDDHRCLPPEYVEFTFDLPGAKPAAAAQVTIGDNNPKILTPVKWTFEQKQVSPGEYELTFIADIESNWHIYTMGVARDTAIPTSFNFNPSDQFELEGKTRAQTPIKKFDPVLKMEMRIYEHSASFTQVVKAKTDKPFRIEGELEYGACNDRACLPPDFVEFAFDIPGSGTQLAETGQVSPNQEVIQAEQAPGGQNSQDAGNKAKADGSLWSFFFLALGAGFLGLLTPCVYPMIPMTISFFMNSSQSKVKARSQALLFGFSIIFIYTFIGVLVSALFGADTIKQVSEHWITNIIFFLLFAVFAASFFGMFEIVLPSWLTNKSDQMVDKGGYVGSFFMALTLVLVSFSCTAPFVGGILVEAATGQVIKPIVGMFGFSLVFGVVFTFLAFFPAILNKMPKSGGWLNSVKVFIAFIILAIGMKYLLVPNQALNWGITREVYLGVWIVLFTLLGFYLLGKIKFSHDSPVDHISVPRLAMVIVTFTFVIYLIPGLFGAPLKAVSGYLPTESSWDLDDIIREATRNISVSGTGSNAPSGLCDAPKYTDRFKLPHGLQGYFDYEQGLACAKKLNKPVFLDIKGHACTNCKVMEKNVWSDPEVLKRLQDDFVIVALYVDDNLELPESEWVTSTFDGKVKKTIGRKNTDFQITRFGVNAQPYYVILDDNGKELVPAVAFEPNVSKYVKFLDDGISAFNKSK